jgi:hypothetical protein
MSLIEYPEYLSAINLHSALNIMKGLAVAKMPDADTSMF